MEERVITTVANDILDELLLGFCFEVHRACKLDYLFLFDMDEESQKEYKVVNKPGVDVFGQQPSWKQLECECPSCGRQLTASRFAPHLEKCLGMGRNSSRIASRRIATTNTSSNHHGQKSSNYSDDSEGDGDDVDWCYQTVPERKYFNVNVINIGGIGSDPPIIHNATPALMTIEERKLFLMQYCGVISQQTGRMCTKSKRCPQHTDEHRQLVRMVLLKNPHSDSPDSLRDNPSPTDSCSTNNSNSNESRKKRGSSKRRRTPVVD